MPGLASTQPTKDMPCRDCGEAVTVNAQTVNPPRCYTCGMEANQRAIREMHLKSGPAYDKWLESNGSSEAMRGNQNARKG